MALLLQPCTSDTYISFAKIPALKATCGAIPFADRCAWPTHTFCLCFRTRQTASRGVLGRCVAGAVHAVPEQEGKVKVVRATGNGRGWSTYPTESGDGDSLWSGFRSPSWPVNSQGYELNPADWHLLPVRNLIESVALCYTIIA